MKHLWAPWRAAYVSGRVKKKGCIFCHPHPRDVVLKSRSSFAVLNLFPYNPGHIMVVPRRHTASWARLSDSECLDLFRLLQRAQDVLAKKLKPHGFNVGINMGRVAGAGIRNHLHIHVVPRWDGDTNFMPVTAHTKVISQSMAALRNLLAGPRAYAR